MSEREQRAWTISALPAAHLLPDAVVAFVDGELSLVAHDRAAAHIARCPLCAAETHVQRQARAAVQSAETPRMPAGLMAALRAIPSDTDLPQDPNGLAVTSDGQLVAVQRPDRAFGAGSVLGSSRPLGSGPSVLRTGHGRRAAQGAGVVAAGLMLGALAMVGPHIMNASSQSPVDPVDGTRVSGGGGVLQANFSAPMDSDVLPQDAARPAPARFAFVAAKAR
ncbi:MAG TPA: zf-HC2 domain-containing protein [Pseudonocardiaceae bacterium]|jgi:hypothetical protein|nr:zf-HC2 domain-containing protein [Pseudonocardiaceae bacterium]